LEKTQHKKDTNKKQRNDLKNAYRALAVEADKENHFSEAY